MKGLLLGMMLMATAASAQINLNDVPADLAVPAVSEGWPAAGKRVRMTTAGWDGTQVHHLLYLPVDWQPQAHLPVLVEYAGNGGYANHLGDTSDGSVEGCMLGYGLSGGQGFIWLVLPFIEVHEGRKQNAVKWWGDVAETKRYCLRTVQEVCSRFGGDPKRVVLTGFSRGAIACNYIGLHDDDIARLWCGMLCHSHYEGEFKHPAPDEAKWPERLKRLGNRPQFISQEGGTQKTQDVLNTTGVMGRFTFAPLPFANHSARWALCDLPLRRQARAWLAEVVR